MRRIPFALAITGALCIFGREVVSQTETSPSPAPTTAAGSAGPIDWSEIRSTVTSDIRRKCDYPFRFRVESDGSYTAGPCTSEGTVSTGVITDVELAQLSRLIHTISMNQLNQQPTCEPGFYLGGGTLDITVQLSANYGLQYHVSDTNFYYYCYRGDKEDLQNLTIYLSDLMSEYYPGDIG